MEGGREGREAGKGGRGGKEGGRGGREGGGGGREGGKEGGREGGERDLVSGLVQQGVRARELTCSRRHAGTLDPSRSRDCTPQPNMRVRIRPDAMRDQRAETEGGR